MQIEDAKDERKGKKDDDFGFIVYRSERVYGDYQFGYRKKRIVRKRKRL